MNQSRENWIRYRAYQIWLFRKAMSIENNPILNFFTAKENVFVKWDLSVTT